MRADFPVRRSDRHRRTSSTPLLAGWNSWRPWQLNPQGFNTAMPQATSLPATERILLGPGPSLIPPRVIRAMAAPVLSHLDPEFVPMLDEVRGLLQRVFRT